MEYNHNQALSGGKKGRDMANFVDMYDSVLKFHNLFHLKTSQSFFSRIKFKI
jgi:hypothetical protein